MSPAWMKVGHFDRTFAHSDSTAHMLHRRQYPFMLNGVPERLGDYTRNNGCRGSQYHHPEMGRGHIGRRHIF